MRLTLVLLGHTFDLSLEPTVTEVEDDEPYDSGYTTAFPVGFIAAYDLPDEVSLPQRNNGWGDEGN